MKAAEKYFDLLQYAKGSKLTPGERMYAENIPKATSTKSFKLAWQTWDGVNEWRNVQADKENRNVILNIRCVPGYSLEVAKACTDGGGRPVVLNFANHLAPGQPGARLLGNTQEEQLLKYTTIGATLKETQYPIDAYLEPTTKEYHYQDHALIYSPSVTILFDESSKPCKVPWTTSFVTSAALLCPKKKGGMHFAEERDFQVTLQKAILMAATAHYYGHDTLILGLWGLGAFDNPPVDMAIVWRTAALAFPSITFWFPMGSQTKKHPFFERLS
eukprot:Phypoly_transcript_14046.p1 GENE.Phypoly_transcript_14046~~Phypoly_transcript_14046.p1  ORF type:complete len:273 (+),score=35.67 Phypoly_transcript_14046:135-953(+)